MNTVQPRKMEELDRISWWLHLSYLCLFEAGVVSGMWQKVNSNLCFLLLFMGPVLMLLSRIAPCLLQVLWTAHTAPPMFRF